MKSGKQRKVELRAKRAVKRQGVQSPTRRAEELRAARADALVRRVDVNKSLLARDNSYSVPAFVERGFYVDTPFTCQHCGVDQIWTATQQKWWYEVAKGGVWTIARLCRACRRRERESRERLSAKSHAPKKQNAGKK